MLPLYLATFTNPYIHQKAEQFCAYKKSQTNLATPLPDAPMADLIRSLCAKYPGKILMIDFWGMGCGPCRAAIQSSKDKRAEIAKRDDVKLIFIAGERTTEGTDAYKQYVAEWLSNEETVCVTDADFTRLQELFRFNGIASTASRTTRPSPPTAAASVTTSASTATTTSIMNFKGYWINSNNNS